MGLHGRTPGRSWRTSSSCVATGVMRGERVAIGKMGKMFIRVRPARAARMGRNPLNGQEIKIPAKPATKVPRFTFSKTFKELALKAKVKK